MSCTTRAHACRHRIKPAMDQVAVPAPFRRAAPRWRLLAVVCALTLDAPRSSTGRSGALPPAEVAIPRLTSSSGALNQPLFVQRPDRAAAGTGAAGTGAAGTGAAGIGELEMYTLQYIPDPTSHRYGLYCALSSDGGRTFGGSELVLRLPNVSSAVPVPAGDALIYLSPAVAAVDLPRQMLHMIILTTSAQSEYAVAVAYTAAAHWPPRRAGQMPDFSTGLVSQVLPPGTSAKTGASPRNLLRLRSGRVIFPWFYFNGQNYSGSDLFSVTSVACDGPHCAGGSSETVFATSASQLTIPTHAPCESCDGAIEPTIAQLPNGTLWMLIRAQTGSLWQSYSAVRAGFQPGDRWSAPEPTNFISSDSPPCLTQLPGGQLLLLWNNALKAFPSPNRSDYPSRQIMHAALASCTDDDCAWLGFREVRRDALLRSAAAHHDYGTAYAFASTYTVRANCADLEVDGQPWHDASGLKYDCAWYRAHQRCDNGSIPGDRWMNQTAATACCHCSGGGTASVRGTGVIVTSGQGLFRTTVFVIPDLSWVTAAAQDADLLAPSRASTGWNDTSDFDRFVTTCTGDFFQRPRPCESSTAMIHHSGPGNCGVGPPKALAIGGDSGVNGGGGAVWNFPSASSGSLWVELSCEPGFAGAVLSLTDFFASPHECVQSEDTHHTDLGCEVDQLNIEKHGLFAVTISTGPFGGQQPSESSTIALAPGRWTNVSLRWDLNAGNQTGTVSADGSLKQILSQQPPQPDRRYSGHANYLRIRTIGCGISCTRGRLLVRAIAAKRETAAHSLVVDDRPTRELHIEPQAQECDGELLHNNICLPKQWPPPTPDTDFSKDHEAAWNPRNPGYLADPPPVIDISVGRQVSLCAFSTTQRVHNNYFNSVCCFGLCCVLVVQLFVDTFLIENMTDVVIEYFNASWIGPVIKPDRSWETNPTSPYPHSPYSKAFSGGVFYNPELQLYQAWYNCGWGGGVCYATSSDGLHFEKPQLGIVKDSPIGLNGWNVSVIGDSNIILLNDPGRLSWDGTWGSHVTIDGSCVIVDLADPDR
eukprot:SAG22_NODE_512_length_9579_cov_27.293143_6_plen_1042_part_00